MTDLTKIEYLGIERILKRGTGKVIEQQEDALLILDQLSGVWMLGCENAAAGEEVLRRNIGDDCQKLMVTDPGLGRRAFHRYGFEEMMECCVVAYYGAEPELTGSLVLKDASEADLPVLTAVYKLESPEDMRRIVQRKKLMLGYEGNQLAGFIGEHLEGSMGLLYVYPEFRHRGYAEELEKAMIARTLKEGNVPFGEVEKNNTASLTLQKKLGMAVSDRISCWMWKS